jgi:hypothetical protein
MFKLGLVALMIGPLSNPASADSCTSLSLSVQPQFRDLLECIDQLKETIENQDNELHSLKSENERLETMICSLALDERDRDSTSLGALLWENECPKPKPPKAPAPKPPKTPGKQGNSDAFLGLGL